MDALGFQIRRIFPLYVLKFILIVKQHRREEIMVTLLTLHAPCPPFCLIHCGHEWLIDWNWMFYDFGFLRINSIVSQVSEVAVF